MLENWTTYKLKELTTKIGSGATPRGGKGAYKESGISLIRSQNVLDFSFSSDGLAFIDHKQAAALNNVTLDSQDVLLNITGDSVARVCKVPDHWLPARVNQHVAIVRANQKILNPDFLLYSLLSKENKNLLLTMAGAGATRNALTKIMIEEFEISVPGIKEQKSIASILSALDDKIELNLQMNKTLEEMAMALYKHWFVDFGPFQDGEFVESELGEIPKGWEVKPIKDFLSIKPINGLYKEKKFQGKGSRWLKMKSVYGLPYIIDQEMELISVTAQEQEKYGCIFNDLVFGRTSLVLEGIGTCAIIKTTKDVPIFESNLFRLRVEPNLLDPNILYLFFKSKKGREEVKKIARQTAAVSITSRDLTEIKIPVLPEGSDILKENIDNIFSKIINNLTENSYLTELRDTLLPKLISGEVRVKDAEKTLSEVL